MVGESFHPRGCWGEDSDHIRLGATVQKLSRLFAFVGSGITPDHFALGCPARNPICPVRSRLIPLVVRRLVSVLKNLCTASVTFVRLCGESFAQPVHHQDTENTKVSTEEILFGVLEECSPYTQSRRSQLSRTEVTQSDRSYLNL